MSRIELLPASYGSYKANLHCHTTLSDGRLTPEEVKAHYLANGYSVVAFTDTTCLWITATSPMSAFSRSRASRWIPTASSTAESTTFNQTCHLCAILRDPARPVPIYRAEQYTGEAIRAKVDEFHRGGYIVNYNHPTWSAEGPDEFLTYGDFDGMEIYNHSAELENNNGNSQNECILALRMLKRPIRMIAADDNHEGRGCEDDSCGGLGGVQGSGAELSRHH